MKRLAAVALLAVLISPAVAKAAGTVTGVTASPSPARREPGGKVEGDGTEDEGRHDGRDRAELGLSREEVTSFDTRPPVRLRSAPMNAVAVSRKPMTAKKTTPPSGGRWSVL